jgi:hypothetical protein
VEHITPDHIQYVNIKIGELSLTCDQQNIGISAGDTTRHKTEQEKSTLKSALSSE